MAHGPYIPMPPPPRPFVYQAKTVPRRTWRVTWPPLMGRARRIASGTNTFSPSVMPSSRPWMPQTSTPVADLKRGRSMLDLPNLPVGMSVRKLPAPGGQLFDFYRGDFHVTVPAEALEVMEYAELETHLRHQQEYANSGPVPVPYNPGQEVADAINAMPYAPAPGVMENVQVNDDESTEKYMVLEGREPGGQPVKFYVKKRPADPFAGTELHEFIERVFPQPEPIFRPLSPKVFPLPAEWME